MSSFGERTRFAILLAVAATFLVAALIGGTVSGGLLLGQPNAAGVATTSLSGSNADTVLSVAQGGTGAALRGTTGSGTGVAGYFSSGSGSAVVGIAGHPDRVAITAANSGATTGRGAALRADGQQNIGLVATSEGATALSAAGSGRGTAGVHAMDRSPDGSGYALVATGDTSITGSLTVTEGCTGCTQLVLASNGASAPIDQGDAVAADGLQIAPDDSTVVVVRPARPGDAVFGLVDRGLIAAPSGEARTGIRAKWLDGPSIVRTGGVLRVAVGGLLTLDGELAGVDAGARLGVGTTPGTLVAVPPGSASVGRYLGARPDGRGVILIDVD